MNEKILVTGGAGFIGSHVVNELLDRGYRVVAVDSFTNYYSVELKQLRVNKLTKRENFVFEQIDISDFAQIENLFSNHKFDGVIHLAAQAGVRLSMGNSDQYVSDNIIGFHNIVRSAIDNNVEGIIYASSSSVYGDAAPIPYSETSLILRPKSIYGVTKLTNELSAEIYSKSNQLRFRGLRFFTVYGPWGRPDMAYFRLAAAALGQGGFTLFGDGSIKRDFTYIDDVVANTLSLFKDMTKKSEGFNDVVNIGGGRPLDMSYLIELISKHSNSEIDIYRTLENQLDSRITVADNTYLKSILGDLKFTELEKGVENLMRWASLAQVRSNLDSWIRSTI